MQLVVLEVQGGKVQSATLALLDAFQISYMPTEVQLIVSLSIKKHGSNFLRQSQARAL